VRVTLLLADAAQAVNGKLYVLGGGWSLTGPDPSAMALAVKIEVPWDRANIKHRWRIELLDGDGVPIEIASAPGGGTQPLRIEGEFEAGRPPLAAGGRYVWRLSIDGFEEDWQVAFSTRSGAPAPAA
jgi:hypothetical protein